MTFQFNAGQRDDLIVALNAALDLFDDTPGASGIMTSAYQTVLDMISTVVGDFAEMGPVEGVDLNVWTWITGAKGVNSSTAGFGGFIRSYTALQYEARYGSEMGPTQMQAASNGVAANFFKNLLANLVHDNTPSEWVLPNIITIGEGDAGAAASQVFGGDYLGSSFKCNTHGPQGIGCCDGQTKQAPQQRGTWRDLRRA